MTAGPDFICIGMARAGTGWLYDQTQHHPDFWMPPVKELRYLDQDFAPMRRAQRRLRNWNARSNQEAPSRQNLDERDRQFLLDANACAGRAMDLDLYASLFRHKGDSLSGDISPGYCSLGKDIIGRLATALPEVRIILLIRDPVARAWSHISQMNRTGKFDANSLEDAVSFRSFLAESPLLQDKSLPTAIVDRWRRSAPNLEFRHYLFDDITERSESVRRDIFQFVGADADEQSGNLPAGHNRKASFAKLPLGEDIKAVLVDHFRDELQACAATLGGAAQEWLRRYGI